MTERACVGLFGTCTDNWRDGFIAALRVAGFSYFTPKVEKWTSEMIEYQVDHLAHDDVIVMVINRHAYGLTSLKEANELLDAVERGDMRPIVLILDTVLEDSLDNDDLRQDSLRARALLRNRLSRLVRGNVYAAHGIQHYEGMIGRTVTLAQVAEQLRPLKPFRAGYREPWQ